jgi:NAD(P)H-dependent flavin oxidoreductase YrpB (nitropropane dioxygenase family)
MQAPLGRVGGADLVVAVSEAGGLGTLGASWVAPGDLRDLLGLVRQRTSAPFCVNPDRDRAEHDKYDTAADHLTLEIALTRLVGLLALGH